MIVNNQITVSLESRYPNTFLHLLIIFSFSHIAAKHFSNNLIQQIKHEESNQSIEQQLRDTVKRSEINNQTF